MAALSSRLVLVASACALVFSISNQISAQTSPSGPSDRARQAAPSPAAPDPYRVDILIRTTLIALSQANHTGNYTVLRDLGSPAFQAANSAARLGEIFSELRRRKLDFSPVLFFNPKLVREPKFDSAGRLQITGFIETRPEQINFDLIFENVAGDWRIFGLAVRMQHMPPEAAATSQPKVRPTAKQNHAAPKKPAGEKAN